MAGTKAVYNLSQWFTRRDDGHKGLELRGDDGGVVAVGEGGVFLRGEGG